MMSTAELKIDLINRIKNTTDQVKLKELLELLKFQADESVYVTSEDDKKAISEARQQIKEGKVIPNGDVQKEISEWLTK
ncbi:hypothetical protein [Chryseobacterium sp.]|uniref:hypothetical protein n=1 Tax=Chryseobacterium sp. TaxID=1871047 RepID=UPI0011C836E9|nr:hypothetical protein [Chryseobacterium sp.]TXF79429.1 hypothetical protein FUA25_03325 [Chryseobacterium sp.]